MNKILYVLLLAPIVYLTSCTDEDKNKIPMKEKPMTDLKNLLGPEDYFETFEKEMDAFEKEMDNLTEFDF